MELKQSFDEWTNFADKRFADKQWLLAKWESFEGVVWPDEKIQIMMKTIEDGLQLKSEHVLADFGCGGGWIVSHLSSKVKTAVGLDFSYGMLENAKSFGCKSPLVQGAIGHLPFVDQLFDRVLCYFVLINMMDDEQVERSILDMVRVLKPGGRLLIGQLPDKAGSIGYEEEKMKYIEYLQVQNLVGKDLRDQNRMPQKLFDIPALEAFLDGQSLSYDIEPSFNPFYYPGAEERVSWRFDLMITREA